MDEQNGTSEQQAERLQISEVVSRVRIPLLATTVDRMLTQRIRGMRAIRDERDRLRAAAAILADIVEATENMQAAQLELLALLNVPAWHRDKGR